jgi:8-O-methyltransferase
MMTPLCHRDVRNQVAVLQVAEKVFDAAVLFALFELGVFRLLVDGPRSGDDLHREVGGDAESLRGLLDAAVALGILSRAEEGYAADEALRDCLGREAAPAYLGEWVAFLHALAGPLVRVAETVRTGRPAGTTLEGAGEDGVAARRLTRAMDAYARGRGLELADHLDWSDTRTLLDLGCGPGTYALAIAERYPAIRATLLDLPGPIAEARRIAAARGQAGALHFLAADALAWVPEHGYDTVLVSNLLHMLGPPRARALLGRCYAMVNPGGRIIVQAQYLNDDRTSPRWATLLNLILRVATPDGRNHSVGETAEWLRGAGFTGVEHLRLSLLNVNSVLIGLRPGGGSNAGGAPADPAVFPP